MEEILVEGILVGKLPLHRLLWRNPRIRGTAAEIPAVMQEAIPGMARTWNGRTTICEKDSLWEKPHAMQKMKGGG